MTAMIARHPDAATLMGFASGTLPEPLAAVVAAHCAMCPACRDEIADMELMGALLLESLPTEKEGVQRTSPRPPEPAGKGIRIDFGRGGQDHEGGLPRPIAQRYGLTLDTIPWRRLAPGIWHHRLALSPEVAGDLRLLKISAGRRMPDHGHGGSELTLVLKGSYTDETGAYGPGDVQDVDDETEHRPVADKDTGCICIIASEKPARFKGFVERMLQPWTGM